MAGEARAKDVERIDRMILFAFLCNLGFAVVIALLGVLLRWCISHKNVTLAILAVILMIVDVVVLYYINFKR